MTAPNAASRVSAIISRGAGVRSKASAVEGMAHLFNTPMQINAPEAVRMVARSLELLLQQIDSAERSCRRQGVPESLYMRQVLQVRSAFNPTMVVQPFEQLQLHLQADVLLAFEWMAYVLPEEENAADLTALHAVYEELMAIRSNVAIELFPVHLRELLIRSLDSLLAALANYSITGIGPLSDAVTKFAIDAVNAGPTIASEIDKASPEQRDLLEKYGALLRKARDVVVTTGKFAEAIEKIWKLAESGMKLLEGNGGP